MAKDTRAYIAACSVCARNKTSHQSPAGLLCPLPVPSRPWSHIAVDFVMGLPSSEGNDTILTIVDRFSKAVHFVPLPKLPTALEMANLLVVHVFRLHGIPLNIMSDRGPQFAPCLASFLPGFGRLGQSILWVSSSRMGRLSG